MKPRIIKPTFINPFMGRGRGPSKEKIKETVLSHAKQHDQIVHGSFAVNTQLPEEYHRPAKDIDVLTHKPRHHMDIMEDKLDAMAGRDAFGEVIMPIVGKEGEFVYKVVKKVAGPDIDVVDYFNMQKIRTKRIKGIRYEDLYAAKRRLQQIIANPELRHRHAKTARDIRRIEAYERSLIK